MSGQKTTESNFEHFFKPDVRKAGEELVQKKAVSLGASTDTQVDAFIRTSSPARVQFSSESIESPNFLVDCNCKAASKGQFCKHIWAVLVSAAEKSPDFFAEKTNLEKGTRSDVDLRSAKVVRPVSDSQKAYLDAQKERQSEYRKQAYQSQKERVKGIKRGKEEADFKASRVAASHEILPDSVLAAFAFFKDNGFPLTSTEDKEAINNAKRILSRIFHPDKGGTNDEMLTLLAHAKALLDHA